MKRKIKLTLTKLEVEALINAGNRGIADLIDTQDDYEMEQAEIVDGVLDKLGAAMVAAGWAEAVGGKS